MPTRQYIGARYVPKIFSGVGGSPEWVSGLSYEALTIVTRLGNSFTSRKTVPSSVGAPENNPEYWANTGNFNAQVGQLSEEVADAQDRIEVLEGRGRNFILIGDSYGAGVNGNGGSNVWGWYKWFESYLSGSNSQIYYHTGATGMHSGNSGFTSSLSFLTMLQDIENFNDFNKDSITDIVVLGGTNDRTGIGTPANIESAIETFMTYVKANYKNANVRIGCLTTLIKEVWADVYQHYRNCVKYGAGYIENLFRLMCNPIYIGLDGTHLTEAGYAFYSPYIANEILVGNVNYKFEIATTLTATEGFEWVDTGNHRLLINVRPRDYNFKFMQSGSYSSLRIKINTAPADGAGTNIRPCDINDCPRMYYPDDSFDVALILGVKDSGVDINRTGRVYMGQIEGVTTPKLQINLSAHIGPAYSGYTNHYIYFTGGGVSQ